MAKQFLIKILILIFFLIIISPCSLARRKRESTLQCITCKWITRRNCTEPKACSADDRGCYSLRRKTGPWVTEQKGCLERTKWDEFCIKYDAHESYRCEKCEQSLCNQNSFRRNAPVSLKSFNVPSKVARVVLPFSLIIIFVSVITVLCF